MSPFFTSERALRLVLAMVGLAAIWLGLNIGLGGIRTLGWQDATPFVRAVDVVSYGVHDSHVRFLGGVFTGIGVLFAVGAVALGRLRGGLTLLCVAIFIGGLARFSAMDFAALKGLPWRPRCWRSCCYFPLWGFG